MLNYSHMDRDVGRRVQEARENQGLNKTELADALGITRASYSPYESGGTRYSIEQLFRLSAILGRSVQWFLGLETGLEDDEDQLLTAYRAIRSPQVKRVALGVVQMHAGLEVIDPVPEDEG